MWRFKPIDSYQCSGIDAGDKCCTKAQRGAYSVFQGKAGQALWYVEQVLCVMRRSGWSTDAWQLRSALHGVLGLSGG